MYRFAAIGTALTVFLLLFSNTPDVVHAQTVSGDVLRAGGTYGDNDRQDPFVYWRSNDNVETIDSWIWTRGSSGSFHKEFAHDSSTYLTVERDVNTCE